MAEHDARVKRGRAETAELVRAISGVQMPERIGAHSRRSMGELVADSGFSAADLDDLRPVVRIGSKVWR